MIYHAKIVRWSSFEWKIDNEGCALCFIAPADPPFFSPCPRHRHRGRVKVCVFVFLEVWDQGCGAVLPQKKRKQQRTSALFIGRVVAEH
jgi:hypothetical protein